MPHSIACSDYLDLSCLPPKGAISKERIKTNLNTKPQVILDHSAALSRRAMPRSSSHGPRHQKLVNNFKGSDWRDPAVLDALGMSAAHVNRVGGLINKE